MRWPCSRPRELPLISYPYEWCFSQLREAALLTLELQRRALAAGMRLKDASAYNIQFDAGRPILIDTLSFEVGDPTQPWPAYRQFCEHFLAPLALIAYRDPRCGLMLRDFIDGIPVDLAARLMPGRTRLRPGLLAHLHLHAGAQRRSQAAGPTAEHRGARRMSQTGQEAILDSLAPHGAGVALAAVRPLGAVRPADQLQRGRRRVEAGARRTHARRQRRADGLGPGRQRGHLLDHRRRAMAGR